MACHRSAVIPPAADRVAGEPGPGQDRADDDADESGGVAGGEQPARCWRCHSRQRGVPGRGHERDAGGPGDAGCVTDARMDGEDIAQAGDGQHPPDLPLPRGQHQVKPSAPDVLPRAGQRGQAAGVDELQALQVNNDIAPAGRHHGQRRRDLRRCCYVKLAAQHHDNMAAALAGTHFYADHFRVAFPLQQQQRRDRCAVCGFAGLGVDSLSGQSRSMCPRAHRNLRIRLLWTSVALCAWLEPRCQMAAPIARRAGTPVVPGLPREDAAQFRELPAGGAGELAR
jgi:hypothetical protein